MKLTTTIQVEMYNGVNKLNSSLWTVGPRLQSPGYRVLMITKQEIEAEFPVKGSRTSPLW